MLKNGNFKKFNKYCGPKLREIISKKRINYYELYGSCLEL